MSIINKRREELIKYLTSQLGINHIRDFSEALKTLEICDLTDDIDLVTVTSTGLIDTLIVLYQFGTLTKVIEVKSAIAEQRK